MKQRWKCLKHLEKYGTQQHLCTHHFHLTCVILPSQLLQIFKKKTKPTAEISTHNHIVFFLSPDRTVSGITGTCDAHGDSLAICLYNGYEGNSEQCPYFFCFGNVENETVHFSSLPLCTQRPVLCLYNPFHVLISQDAVYKCMCYFNSKAVCSFSPSFCYECPRRTLANNFISLSCTWLSVSNV